MRFSSSHAGLGAGTRSAATGRPPDCIPLRDDPDHGRQPRMRVGFGACARSGCGCRHYEGWAGTCGNETCRHAIGDHW